MKPEHALYQVFALAPAGPDAARRKAAVVTAAVDAIEGEPGEAVNAAVRRHLEALYDQARADAPAAHFCGICGGPPHGEDNPGPC
jgi:DNA-binding GntR family transcriptional regulator